MGTELERIAEMARKHPGEKLTTLAHHINEDTLKECHRDMDRQKAVGVDGVSWDRYEQSLQENISGLMQRMRKGAYRPQPVRRVYIPKAGSDKMRPLGIPCHEDKLVQMQVSRILDAVYEQEFLDCSFGFRPDRNCHDALKVLNHVIEKRNINYVVDADIKGFFDNVNHAVLMELLQMRIGDPKLLSLIKRILVAGVMEDGQVKLTEKGVPQGGGSSAVLSNVYLHHVLDSWFMEVVKGHCKGEAHLVRYADDFVACFQYEDDAKRFYASLVKRLEKFGLEVAVEKTRIIAFGRSASHERERNGQGKPETFDFLGFTHYCGKSTNGRFRIKRKTSAKKFRASLARVKEWLHLNLVSPTAEVISMLAMKLMGHYRYYGITDNSIMIGDFYHHIRKMLFKWFCRRSQKTGMNWDKFQRHLRRYPIPRGRITVNIYDVRPELIRYIR
jgi:group II intron reverse transcriptase/maturase